MDLDIITQYILALVPAVSALMGMAVIVGVGIAKIKNALANSDSKVDELSNRNKALIDQNSEMRKENKELRKALIDLNKKIDVITAKRKGE